MGQSLSHGSMKNGHSTPIEPLAYWRYISTCSGDKDRSNTQPVTTFLSSFCDFDQSVWWMAARRRQKSLWRMYPVKRLTLSKISCLDFWQAATVLSPMWSVSATAALMIIKAAWRTRRYIVIEPLPRHIRCQYWQANFLEKRSTNTRTIGRQSMATAVGYIDGNVWYLC